MFMTLKNVIRALHVPTAAEREMAYLNESVSRVDLELRQRQIDAGLFRNRPAMF
jgi:hypothetical protein